MENIEPFNLEKNVIPFDEIDPYNPQNTLRGFVNRRQGNLYGSLFITHVNNISCKQTIFCTPKMHYPFSKEDKWSFPESDTIIFYPKEDGTNIYSYTYIDINNTSYLTYKTRLRPFLGASKYGNFKSLWDEMLEKYPDIKKLCHTKRLGFSFELFGKRNKILIEYDVSLDTTLLFARQQKNGLIVSPHTMEPTLKKYNVPYLKTLTILNVINKEIYLDHQQTLENALDVDEENKILRGKEGTIMYFIKNDNVSQIKCKSKTILKYHWGGDAINYMSIFTTVINAFENFDSPTIDDVNQLLAEEFDEGKITKSLTRTQKILDKVTFDRRYQHKLSIDYNEQCFNINKDKATCMRWFAEHYPKTQAKRIYTLLKQYVDKHE